MFVYKCVYRNKDLMQGYNLSGERLVTRRLSCSPEQLFLMSHFISDIVSEVYLFGCLFLVITQGYNAVENL